MVFNCFGVCNLLSLPLPPQAHQGLQYIKEKYRTKFLKEWLHIKNGHLYHDNYRYQYPTFEKRISSLIEHVCSKRIPEFENFGVGRDYLKMGMPQAVFIPENLYCFSANRYR